MMQFILNRSEAMKRTTLQLSVWTSGRIQDTPRPGDQSGSVASITPSISWSVLTKLYKKKEEMQTS